MKYDKTILSARFELLEKIDSFLTSCGWQTHHKDNETLYARDSKGGGIVFRFIAYWAGYGTNVNATSEHSTIRVCNSIDENLAYNQQEGSYVASFFSFQQDTNKELSEVRLIGDSENFTLQINCASFPAVYHNSEKDPPASAPFMLVFSYGYLNKSHEFSGGAVAYSSIYRKSFNIVNTDFTMMRQYSSDVPFTRGTKTMMSLGGVWRDLNPGNYNDIDLRQSLILTNLIPANTTTTDTAFNALSSLSARGLLEIAKSNLSGLNTIIKPLFYYKNNVDKFVYAGSLENIRVIKEQPSLNQTLSNGQILYLGDKTFIVLKPYHTISNNMGYDLAVRIE